MKRDRNTAIELLRLISMLFIVYYHLISYYLYLVPHENVSDIFFKSLLPSMHIGVILFVLISGYFGIRPSIKGIQRIIGVVFIYYVPIEILCALRNGTSIMHVFMFISYTPYWFVRCYLYLYLFSPILNHYLQEANFSKRFYLLSVLLLISMYFGLTKGDPMLVDGKNLSNFMFLYVLGNTLRTYQSKWEEISSLKLFSAYLLGNLLLIISLNLFPDSNFLWWMSFPYQSPILMLNAIAVFIIVCKQKIKSIYVNYLAESAFAIYIIHCEPFFHRHVIMSVLEKMGGGIQVLFYLFVMTLFVMIGCIVIDNLLNLLLNGLKIKTVLIQKTEILLSNIKSFSNAK